MFSKATIVFINRVVLNRISAAFYLVESTSNNSFIKPFTPTKAEGM